MARHSPKKSESAVGTIPRSLQIAYSLAALVALAGLADATYLTVQSLTGETLVCGGSADCSKVLGSAYAHIGPIPLAGLGALGYFAAFSLATFCAFGYRRLRIFFASTVWLMFAAAIGLLCVQAFILHAFCRYCLFSAATTFLLTGILVATTPTEPPRSC